MVGFRHFNSCGKTKGGDWFFAPAVVSLLSGLVCLLLRSLSSATLPVLHYRLGMVQPIHTTLDWSGSPLPSTFQMFHGFDHRPKYAVAVTPETESESDFQEWLQELARVRVGVPNSPCCRHLRGFLCYLY